MKNKLAEGLDGIASKYLFKGKLRLRRLESEDQYKRAIEDGVCWDARVRIETAEGMASVFTGLAYDPRDVRTQSYFLEDNKNVVATTTFLIAPKEHLMEQRYFRREANKVSIKNIEEILGERVPSHCISPAWTRVSEGYKGDFAMKGFRFIKEALDFIRKESRGNVLMKIVAEGVANDSERKDILEISRGREHHFPVELLPFNADLLGKNTPGSNSTIKIARLLGFNSIEGVSELPHLGPIMVKKFYENT